MKTFRSLTDLGVFVAVTLPGVTRDEMRRGLERCAALVEHTAKTTIDSYQDAVSPRLPDSTQEERERLGHASNDPLSRSGKFSDTIKHETEPLRVVIGSTADEAAWREFGTDQIPPRPFMGPAVIHNEKAILRTLGLAVVRGISGG